MLKKSFKIFGMEGELKPMKLWCCLIESKTFPFTMPLNSKPHFLFHSKAKMKKCSVELITYSSFEENEDSNVASIFQKIREGLKKVELSTFETGNPF